ncbi:MAG: UDP-2,3-diacylglucosamine diphosphatase [Reichenbachiella sp.]
MTLENSKLQLGKKIYFASDFHLGVPDEESSLIRERKIVAWLDCISVDAQQIFLVGDLFDFWFEYRHVAPKGFVRFLGKLAELSDKGITLVIFCGNHDLWFNDYLNKEMGAIIITEPISVMLGDNKLYIAHGDGLGPGGLKFKIIKSIFTNTFCKWLFGWLHPNIGYGLARFWSSLSKASTPIATGNEKLIIHSSDVEKNDHHDFYIYGDSHIPKYQEMENDAVFVNLGDWVSNYTYAELDEHGLRLKTFKE